MTRKAAGNLVYAREPFRGPLPHFGNGYLAAPFNGSLDLMAYTKGPKMFVAGVFTGTLPPPFGPNTGAHTSYRAGIPFVYLASPQLPRVALALDFERAWVEELHVVVPAAPTCGTGAGF